MQMADEVPGGRGADSRQGFWKVPVQIADEVAEGSGVDSC